MNQMMINELPGRGLHLLLMGAAAHEVECEGHVAVQERHGQEVEPERTPRELSVADLNRLFRGA
ncbi:MAG: hypothetical protein HYY34_02625 [Chloroflexi bacterium]|nr:hypothetical protein [Chloroflexota bacterium]